ncbi:hypothetical protein BLNAU_14081 [Blattamonas nauphoetae]|uniref:Uncharacterized protein n=1 Tax=Blattamonas nauphoetae TaxID=2049346 RepID=A0ABQ9XI52_9EUKA|nr:hypothetical protein BLNAU_14081 [Blattamonas nauphoetae]
MVLKRKAMAKTNFVQSGGVTVSNPSDFQRQISAPTRTLRTLTQGAPRTADRHKNAACESVRSTNMESNNAQANSVLEAVEQTKKNNQKYSDFVTNARQERSLNKKGVTDINLGLDSDQLDTKQYRIPS